MAVAWDHDLVAGVARLDDDHREILTLIHELFSAAGAAEPSWQQALDMLEWLERYLLVHVTTEERVMSSAGYGGLDEHVADHSRLTTRLTALRLRVQVGSIKRRVLADAVRGLADDVTVHIDTFDRYFSRYLRSRKLS